MLRDRNFQSQVYYGSDHTPLLPFPCQLSYDSIYPSAAEFEYTFVEEEDENTFTPHIGKRVAKKDIIRAEIKLIERPGIHPHTSSSLSTCT